MENLFTKLFSVMKYILTINRLFFNFDIFLSIKSLYGAFLCHVILLSLCV